MARLHNHFLLEKLESSKLPFCAGDVDVFLQASPFTRALTLKLADYGMEGNLQSHIFSFLGGCGLVQGDLHRFSKQLCENDLEKRFEGIGKFVYALTKNGLSFMLAKHLIKPRRCPRKIEQDLSEKTWPRTSQSSC